MVRDAEEEQRLERKHARVGEFLEAVSQGRGAAGTDGGRVTEFRVRLPTEEEPSTLLIVKAMGGTERYIAFVGAFSVTDAVLAWRARDKGGSTKWREDVPWDQRA